MVAFVFSTLSSSIYVIAYSSGDQLAVNVIAPILPFSIAVTFCSSSLIQPLNIYPSFDKSEIANSLSIVYMIRFY